MFISHLWNAIHLFKKILYSVVKKIFLINTKLFSSDLSFLHTNLHSLNYAFKNIGSEPNPHFNRTRHNTLLHYGRRKQPEQEYRTEWPLHAWAQPPLPPWACALLAHHLPGNTGTTCCVGAWMYQDIQPVVKLPALRYILK